MNKIEVRKLPASVQLALYKKHGLYAQPSAVAGQRAQRARKAHAVPSLALTLLAAGTALLAFASLLDALREQRWWHCPRCFTFYSASGKRSKFAPHHHNIKNKVCHECT